MENNIGIYLYTNVHTCKVYVGQSNNLKKRHDKFKCFNNRYAGRKINRARKKYPHIEDWDYKILVYCSEEELDFYESYYIGVYDAVRSGYNCESGGCKNKHPDEETRKNISKGQKAYYDIPENLEKHVEAHACPVVQLTLDGEFVKEWKSAKQAKREGGYNDSGILKCCSGKQQIHAKHRWMKAEDYYKMIEGGVIIGKLAKIGNSIPVVQLTLDGEFVKEWQSARQAEREGDYCCGCISDCCCGRCKTYKNCRWMKTEDYYKMIEDGFIIGKVVKRDRSEPVVQLTLDGEFVKEWKSATEAENEGGFNNSKIGACCKNPNKTHKKCRWMKASEYYNKKESA